MKRSKRICLTALSALAITLFGVVLGFVGNRDVFVDAIGNLTKLLPDYWYVVIVPGVLVLLLIADIVLKALRRDRNVVSLFAILLNVLAFLLVVPAAYIEFLDFTTPPHSLVYVSGAVIILIAYLVLLVVGVMELFGRIERKAVKEGADETADEVYEETEEGEPVLGEVEYLDEEVEDEEDLEVDEDEEADEPPAKKGGVAKGAKKGKKEVEKQKIYHIMKRAKDDRWIVKIAQSRKAIKIFDTQKEAIEYAEVLAGNNNGVVRVFASKGANKGRIII